MNFSQQFSSIETREVADTGLHVSSLGVRLQEYVHDQADFDQAVAAGMNLVDTFPLPRSGVSDVAQRRVLGEQATLLGRIGNPVGGCCNASDALAAFLPACDNSSPNSHAQFRVKANGKALVERELDCFDFSYESVMRAFSWMCVRLGSDHVDILALSGLGATDQGALNDSVTFPVAMNSGYKALEELRANGNVKAIAIASNDIDVCNKALEAGDWDAIVLSHRYTLLEQWPLFNLLPKCVETNTSMLISEPFNSGILSGSATWNGQQAPDFVLARVRNIEHICTLHKVPLAAAALQFPLGHPSIASVIPTLGSVEQVQQLNDWWNYPIPSSLWDDLKLAGVLHEEAPVPQTKHAV